MSISKILEGKKTYIGVITTILGLFLGEADVSMIVEGLDKILIALGAVLAAVGRFKAKPSPKSGTGNPPGGSKP